MIVDACTNRFKKAILAREVNLVTDDFKIALMIPTFVFDKRLHNNWSDVSAFELPAGNGYSAGGISMTISGEITQDDVLDKGVMSWNAVRWDATPGDIPETGAAIIYDNTHASKINAGCSDFDVNYLTEAGKFFKFSTVQLLVA